LFTQIATAGGHKGFEWESECGQLSHGAPEVSVNWESGPLELGADT